MHPEWRVAMWMENCNSTISKYSIVQTGIVTSLVPCSEWAMPYGECKHCEKIDENKVWSGLLERSVSIAVSYGCGSLLKTERRYQSTTRIRRGVLRKSNPKNYLSPVELSVSGKRPIQENVGKRRRKACYHAGILTTGIGQGTWKGLETSLGVYFGQSSKTVLLDTLPKRCR